MTASARQNSTVAPTSRATDRRARASARAADALLRDHPGAVVFAQSVEGHIVPIPDSLGLDAYPVLASEGRTGVDLCVAEDRMTVVHAWLELKRVGVAETRARLRTDPEQWRTVRMLDLLNSHGVVLTVLWVSAKPAENAQEPALATPPSTTARFCSRKQDREGNVIECDDAYLEMFGYESETQVVGQPTFERVHPEDQARLIESWIAMIASGRVQMSRVRMKRQDESWLWVDTTYHNCLSEDRGGHVLAECIDVSAEMAAQEALRDREELLRRLLEEMPDGLLQLDGQRRVVYHNPRLLEVLGVGEEHRSAPGSSGPPTTIALAALLARLTGPAVHALEDVLVHTLESGAREDVELDAVFGSGEQRRVLFKVRPLMRENGSVTGTIASVQDVTDSARARAELEKRATFDALTGCHNRPSILAALEGRLVQSQETTVIYIDLDCFKAVNDSFGHAAGDDVLIQVAERLRGALRAGDELGRLGGDEFLVLLPGLSGAAALSAGERIGEVLHGIYNLPSGQVEMRASVGVAWARQTRDGAEQLIERADAAMYRSKQRNSRAVVLATHR